MWPGNGVVGHSECGRGVEFWDLEDHEVFNSLLKTTSAVSPRGKKVQADDDNHPGGVWRGPMTLRFAPAAYGNA
eukprot:7455942-Pyramimonas_sp.AAC.1